MPNNKELISEIRNRIQFLVTIAIFFSGVLYYFFNVFDKNNASRIALQYALIVIFYLLSYFFFELFKNKINKTFLAFINVLTLLGVVVFIIPIFYLGVLKNELSGFIDIILFNISIWGLFIIPALIFLTICIACVLPTKKLVK